MTCRRLLLGVPIASNRHCSGFFFPPMHTSAMRNALLMTAFLTVALTSVSPELPAQVRLNPVVELLEKGQPVFGLYAPANRRVRPGGAPIPPDSLRSMDQLALEALGANGADYIFDGTMEGDFDGGYRNFTDFAAGMAKAGNLRTSPTPRFRAPLFVKTPGFAANPALARERIARQLNLGVSGIVFVDVETAAEMREGIQAVRLASAGGTRPDVVGDAPARWGMSEAEYKRRADVYPLNKQGELITFAIVESKEGLANIREIAAVPGISVLFPGAGTLRGVFTSTDASGARVFDEKGWEAAIQSVLSACKEFNVPCGYPAGEADIEARMSQGFNVFVIGWGTPGFKAVELGRAKAGRAEH